jgi:hypothetical protein
MVSKKIIGVLCGILLSCALMSNAPNAIAADNATVSSFGEPINYGNVPSAVRDFFPVGVVAVADLGHSPNLLWRWLGSRESGRLQALKEGNKQWRDLKFPVALKGIYTVQFLIPQVIRGKEELWPIELNAKLAGDKKFDLVSTPKTRDYNEWVTWKKIDLTGQTLVIGHPEGSSSAISGIRFVPEDGGKTVTWQGTNLIEATRQSNDIHEDSNPADVAKHFEPIFQQMQSMRMNTVLAVNVNAASAQLAVLNMAQRYHLKVILDDKPLYSDIESQVMKLLETDPTAAKKLVEDTFAPVINNVKNHPALLAYSLHDEPYVKEAPGYSLVYDLIRKLDPKHPATGYLCRASWAGDAESVRVRDNMKKFVDAVHAQVLFNDLYPIRVPASDSARFMNRYVESLDDDVRQAGGRPLWIAAQTIGNYKNILRFPTPAEIRVQAYLSMAHGATGIMYYTYNGGDASLLDEHGNPTPNLVVLGQVSEALSRLAPVMLTLQRVKIVGEFPGYLDVQGFTNKHGKHFVMAVNKDVNAAHSVNLALPGRDVHRVVNVRSEKVLSLRQQAVNLDLAPGDGVLLQLE